MALVNGDCLKKSDAIICLEGDGLTRVPWAIELFKKKLAKSIVISGGLEKCPFSVPAGEMAKEFVKKGVPRKNLILEEKSQFTFEQGREVMALARERSWKKIILIASAFHQPRAFLTFLKAMEEAELKIQIFNAPAPGLPWFQKTPLNKTRFELLEEEFEKIEKYYQQGHLTSIQ
ncbi:MAG: YdcF family protein [Candidatus Nealsonbacteria bacterium]|nr:YdcF family protein [Candidatus Nealsonbacteria bacterium]